MIRALLLLTILLLTPQPSIAIREGTATADIFIKRYAQSGDFGKLALWHETAAECLTRISVPMNKIAYDYYIQHKYKKWAARAEKEAQEIQARYEYHRKSAKVAWRKSKTADPVLNTERENIAKFIALWLPRYPNRFYTFGIYPTFFRKHREMAEQKGDYVKALQLEADAAEMCATQYEKIPIASGLKGYQKHRDAYRQHASLLRSLAQQNPKMLPAAVESGKRIIETLESQTVLSQWKADAIVNIAKSDARIQAALVGQSSIHAYPVFQGFAWIVTFTNHSHGNIVTAIIDEKIATSLIPIIYKSQKSQF